MVPARNASSIADAGWKNNETKQKGKFGRIKKPD